MNAPTFPTPATDRAAAIAALADQSPFAVAFKRELGDDRVAAIVAWAMTGGAK